VVDAEGKTVPLDELQQRLDAWTEHESPTKLFSGYHYDEIDGFKQAVADYTEDRLQYDLSDFEYVAALEKGAFVQRSSIVTDEGGSPPVCSSFFSFF
jgi:hypothetical protein